MVATRHERKTTMADLADGFIALPGGAGTIEKIIEQWTWAQLGIHRKPCGFLNTNSYFDPLRKMIDRMADNPGPLIPIVAALNREIGEELKCSIAPDSPVFLGAFRAPAANENGCFVEAAWYHVRLLGAAIASAEIEEIVWLDPRETDRIELAPLSRNFVLPLARQHNSADAMALRKGQP
jgi:hypothetical protein